MPETRLCRPVPVHAPPAGQGVLGVLRLAPGCQSRDGRQHQHFLSAFPAKCHQSICCSWSTPSLAKLAPMGDTARGRQGCNGSLGAQAWGDSGSWHNWAYQFCLSQWLQSPGLAGGSHGTALRWVSLYSSQHWSIRKLAAYCLTSG